MIRGGLVILALTLLSLVLTARPFGFLWPVLYFDHLHPALWLVGLGATVVSGMLARRGLKRWRHGAGFAATVVAVAGLAGVLAMTLAADVWRGMAIARFAPDHVQSRSFLASLRIAPRAYQFDLHAAMVKQCTPYGWSYREMSVYEIPETAIANVMPVAWFAPGTRCGPADNLKGE